MYPSGPYNSAGICVEYLAEVQINKMNTAQSFGTEKVLLREDKLIRYNLLLINLVSYLILHLIDNGVQGPELNLNFGLFFCRPSFLNMGRKFVIFHLTGDSPSCYDLSEEVESSLVMVLTDSFAPLRWIP